MSHKSGGSLKIEGSAATGVSPGFHDLADTDAMRPAYPDFVETDIHDGGMDALTEMFPACDSEALDLLLRSAQGDVIKAMYLAQRIEEFTLERDFAPDEDGRAARDTGIRGEPLRDQMEGDSAAAPLRARQRSFPSLNAPSLIEKLRKRLGHLADEYDDDYLWGILEVSGERVEQAYDMCLRFRVQSSAQLEEGEQGKLAAAIALSKATQQAKLREDAEFAQALVLSQQTADTAIVPSPATTEGIRCLDGLLASPTAPLLAHDAGFNEENTSDGSDAGNSTSLTWMHMHSAAERLLALIVRATPIAVSSMCKVWGVDGAFVTEEESASEFQRFDRHLSPPPLLRSASDEGKAMAACCAATLEFQTWCKRMSMEAEAEAEAKAKAEAVQGHLRRDVLEDEALGIDGGTLAVDASAELLVVSRLMEIYSNLPPDGAKATLVAVKTEPGVKQLSTPESLLKACIDLLAYAYPDDVAGDSPSNGSATRVASTVPPRGDLAYELGSSLPPAGHPATEAAGGRIVASDMGGGQSAGILGLSSPGRTEIAPGKIQRQGKRKKTTRQRKRERDRIAEAETEASAELMAQPAAGAAPLIRHPPGGIASIEEQWTPRNKLKHAKNAHTTGPGGRTCAQLEAAGALPWAALSSGGIAGLRRHQRSKAAASGRHVAPWSVPVRQRSEMAVHDADAITSGRIVSIGERTGGGHDALAALSGGGRSIVSGTTESALAEGRLLQSLCDAHRVSTCSELFTVLGDSWKQLRLELESPAKALQCRSLSMLRRSRVHISSRGRGRGQASAVAGMAAAHQSQAASLRESALASRRRAAQVMLLLRSAGMEAGDTLLRQLDPVYQASSSHVLSSADLICAQRGTGSSTGPRATHGPQADASSLDLHGCHTADAAVTLQRLLAGMYRTKPIGSDRVSVKVVTGHGRHSTHVGQSTLRTAVQEYLRALRAQGKLRYTEDGLGAFGVTLFSSP